MIRILEKNIADKIAAGEVIDRPVSIVKELVENSLDAGASSVIIEITDGGKSYIRVTDNGCGIESEQVETAFLRHATSKISNEKDLDAIETLGFRGEALASICAVARVELITKTIDSKTGRRILVESSETLKNEPVGCPGGTTVTVRDLFFNVPARRKFLGSSSAETRRIMDFASRIALSYPDVRFNVINNTGKAFTTTGKGDILTNIINIYGTDISRDLIPVENAEKGFILKGYISSPGMSLSSRNRQVFCVNGRVVTSHVLEKAVDNAYKERLFKGRFPAAFLFVSLPAEKLDVNIHPTKKEIRFDNNDEIEDFITRSLCMSLQKKGAVPTASPVSVTTYERKMFDEKFQREAKSDSIKEDMDTEQVDIKLLLKSLRSRVDEEKKSNSFLEKEVTVSNSPFDFEKLRVTGTIFSTYIIAQDEDAFYLIDQHAAHERVLYEQLIEQYKSSEKASQALMIPINLSVPADVATYENAWISDIRKLGYNIELFGKNNYLIREIPAFMQTCEAERFLADMFNEFENGPKMSGDTLEMIIKRSCKSAVKAGDTLKDAETDALLSRLKLCKNPFSCPHGRPTFVKMTKHDIEKMFKRK